MSRPSTQPSGRARRASIAERWVAALLVAIAVAGCGGAAPTPFDPSGPCTGDGSAEGAYPELEALIPTSYEDRPPDLLDSGRNCTAENLGTLVEHGVDEVRFAGGTWDFGSDIAVVLAVFSDDALTTSNLREWWVATARASPRTQVTRETALDIAGREGYRIDTKTGERLQTVVLWPSAAAGRINVVLSHNLPDPKIEAATAAFGDS